MGRAGPLAGPTTAVPSTSPWTEGRDAPVRVRARPEPVRRTGLLVPLLMGVFSLAIIFTLVALYSVTSEFRSAGRTPPSRRRRSPWRRLRPRTRRPGDRGGRGATGAAGDHGRDAVDRGDRRDRGAGDRVRSGRAEPPKPGGIPGTPGTTKLGRPTERRPAPVPRGRRTGPQSGEGAAGSARPVVRAGGVRPGPGVMPPIPLDMPRFSYPAAARGQGLDIDVRLDLLVDQRGRVIEAVSRGGHLRARLQRDRARRRPAPDLPAGHPRRPAGQDVDRDDLPVLGA